MKPEFIRCPHCGLLHPSTARSCPATFAPLPQIGSEPPAPVRGVAEAAAMPRLLVQTTEGERTCYLRPTNSLGRHPNNSIQILDKIVSKEHCRIERDGERFMLRDLGSLNGTYVNGERVRGSIALSSGDLITMGATRAVFYEAGVCPPSAGEPDEGSAAERFLAHLTLPKPAYQPGETLYARAAVLDAETRAPLARSATVAFEVRAERGDIIAHRAGQVAAGVAPFSWSIPADLAAGEYTLFALFPVDGFPPAEIPFSIRARRAPRLHASLDLARSAYGPGDEVWAALSVTRTAEGGEALSGRAVFVATVDGGEIHRSEVALDAAGFAAARFRLPAAIEAGQGTLAATVTSGDVEESVQRALPIAIHRVRLSLYPEGGDLILGLPARLYVEARTPQGKPVEALGRIIDGAGAVLARFRTEHEGRGRVALTPAKAGRAYMAVLDEPAAVSELFPLPEVRRDGLTLLALDDATRPEEAVRLRLFSSAATKARVVLYAREREVAAVRVDLPAGEGRDVSLTPPGAVDGVLRATVYDAAGLPRAERLIFRAPRRSLRVAIEPPSAPVGVNSPASVRIRTTSSEGQPVSATVTLAVVDASALDAGRARRERPPRLRAQALLGSEVRELGDPDAYLGEGESAQRRLDLLLGTQGWRRFAFYDVTRFIAEHGDRASRVFARRRPPAPGLGMLAAGKQVAALGPGGAAVPLPDPNSPTAPRTGPRPELPKTAPPDHPAQAAPARADRRVQLNMPLPAMRPPGPQATVREYAYRAQGAAGVSAALVETLYWNAGLSTRESGEATIAFDLPGEASTFTIRADAFGADGALGEGDAAIVSRRLFSLSPKLPAEVCAGDVIDLPVTLVNDTAERLDAQLTLEVGAPLIAGREPLALALAPRSRERVILPVAVGSGQGVAEVTLSASATALADEVRLALPVALPGAPVELHAGGELSPAAPAVHRFTIPEAIEPGSLTAELWILPAALAVFELASQALAGAPMSGSPESGLPEGGLLEQRAGAYASALCLQQLAAHRDADARLFARAAARVERGHRDLAGHECEGGGFDGFGAAWADLALTAFLLVQFTDVAAVHPVDGAMLTRTLDVLLAHRDGRGGFARAEQDAEAAGGASWEALDAFITWALGQAKITGLEAEIARVRELAQASDDSYLLALGANVLLDADAPEAAAVLDRLAHKQDADGAVRGALGSVTCAAGTDLLVETTSLAILAWLKAGQLDRAARAITFLRGHPRGGRFGGAQATVLALKAIAAHEARLPRARHTGAVWVRIDGRPVGEIRFTPSDGGLLALPSFAGALTAGEHQVEIELSNGAPMPYALRLRYHAAAPRAEAGKIALRAALAREEIAEGEEVELSVELVNTTGEDLARVSVALGLPGGLEPHEEQLKALQAEGRIAAFSRAGQKLVLHRERMAPGERAIYTLSLLGAVPGAYLGQASRAFLAADSDEEAWAPPIRARVIARR